MFNFVEETFNQVPLARTIAQSVCRPYSSPPGFLEASVTAPQDGFRELPAVSRIPSTGSGVLL